MTGKNVAVKEELEGVTEQVPSIFKNRNFLFLWAAALLSSFGISFFLFSESWYIVNVLNLEASLGFIYIASSVPRIIFMVISGTVADRVSKTKIMFVSDFSRSILLGGLVLWFVFGDITLWTFVGVAFVFGILDAFFWAAESAVIPSIIHKDNLTRGNSIIQMTNQASFILAPMLAGLIIAFGNYEIVFATTAVMLLVASVLIYLIRVPLPSSTESLSEKSFWSSFKEGVQYVRNSRPLMLIVLTTIFLNLFLVGPMTMGLPLFVKSVLGGNAVDFSLLEAALAGGMLIGAIVIGLFNVSRNRGHIALLALLIAGLAFMGFSFAETLWLSMVMLVIFGACLSCCNIPFISAVQSMIEESMLGRVMGLISLASMGLIPVSYVITSLVLTMGISINTIMSAGAILLVLYSTFVYMKFTELREIT
ncbi:MFS transporter [Guptibacillus hwajinpoensis]|uniref:MFS family permease n=1 Tax=Guptibacillus hwajinpoensis TaxID=208199 RepID=A0ABU0K6Z3_9BACL|nr:MFS transporter [Alkalihalobacillus hemicentroti]MDQ0485146.1 MFS family permease [Alkalihalobacillus hemicentroti]